MMKQVATNTGSQQDRVRLSSRNPGFISLLRRGRPYTYVCSADVAVTFYVAESNTISTRIYIEPFPFVRLPSLTPFDPHIWYSYDYSGIIANAECPPQQVAHNDFSPANSVWSMPMLPQNFPQWISLQCN